MRRMRNALIASIVLNVFLFAGVLGLGYGWPLFLHVKQVLPSRERHVSFFETFGVEGRDVVFVGDGLTADARWTELFPGLPVRNRGISGDTSADVAMRIGQVAAGRPASIFLLVGGEDAAAEKTVEETAVAHGAILERIRELSPDTRVFVQSILPRGSESSEDVDRRNRAIREVAESEGAAWIDLGPVFAGPEGAMLPGLSNDGVHLLGSGYLAWRDAIVNFVGPPPTGP